MGLQLFRSRLGKVFLAVMASCVLMTSAAFAQEAPQGEEAASEQQALVLKTVVNGFLRDFSFTPSGAFVFQWMIVVAAAFGVGIAFERFYTITLRSKVNTKKFTNQLIKYIEAKDYDKAIALCNASPAGVLPVLAKAGLEAAKRNVGARAVQDALDEETLKVMPMITKRLTWVSVLANVATLMGLMGTIFGLMYTFAGLALVQNPKEKANVLTTGIATAMNTTLLGLMCAVPLNLLFQYLSQSSRALVDDVDECSVRLINALSRS